jgi:hypothetical protein
MTKKQKRSSDSEARKTAGRRKATKGNQGTTTAAQASPAAEAPPFGSLSSKKVASLVSKLATAQPYQADVLIEKAGVACEQAPALRWHIARHGLLDPRHPTLLSELGKSARVADAEAVFAVLPRLAAATPGDPGGTLDLLPGWPLAADQIALRALELDPARLEAMLPGAAQPLRAGIQLVLGRHGHPLGEDDRALVVKLLAQREASGSGLPSEGPGSTRARLQVEQLAENGGRSKPYPDAIDLVRALGATEEMWRQAVGEAVKEGRFSNLKNVLPGLAALPVAEAVQALARAPLTLADVEREIAALVALWGDDPLQLAQAALAIPRTGKGADLREAILMVALAGMRERGMSVPEGLEREPQWSLLVSRLPPWSGSSQMSAACRKALEAIPRERVLDLIPPILARGSFQKVAAGMLSVHFDEELAREVVASDWALGDPGALGLLGAPGLPLLAAALESLAEGDEKRRVALVKGIRFALAFVGATGGSFEERFDRFVSCSPEERYWPDESQAIFVRALRAMPEPRRIATLQRLFSETPQVERPFLGVGTVEEPAFRESAARLLVERCGQIQDATALQSGLRALGEGGLESFRSALSEAQPNALLKRELGYVFGKAAVEALGAVEESPRARLCRLAGEQVAKIPASQRARIYLLERRDLDERVPERRPGSFSSSRGAGPAGFDPGLAEGEEHVLTLDLEEVPELAGRFPGARALALFAPDPDLGEGWEHARLVPVPAHASPPSDGTPITVTMLEVPSSIFDPDGLEQKPELRALRGLVSSRPGYLFGEPIYVRDDEDDRVSDRQFLMQLSEQIGELELGEGVLCLFDGLTLLQRRRGFSVVGSG